MKSQVHLVDGYTGVAMAVLTDIQGFLGTNSLEAARDNERLLSLIKHRGLGFLTLTLPAVGKLFDRALATGCLPALDHPGFGRSGKGSVLPRFLGSVWSQVFSEDGSVLESPSIIAIASLRQLFYCFKKARLDCDPERITSVLNDFKRVDEALPEADYDWSDPLGVYDGLFDVHLVDVHLRDPGNFQVVDGVEPIRNLELPAGAFDVLQFVCDIVASSFGEFDPEAWAPKHGRGAVADARLGKSFKYDFPVWPSRLETIFPSSHFGFANVGVWADSVHTGDIAYEDFEVPGRLITVPKDMKGPRLIAAEPTSNQYCQQAILAFFVRTVHSGLLRDLINFSDQEASRSWALEASRTDSHATIDLSHASDSVSCWIVERLFRRNKTVLSALMATRTSSVTFPSGEVMNLKKFSTMGAATTFPVQSIFYACVCIAAELWADGVLDFVTIYSHLKDRKWSSRVFGDDLISPKRSAKYVVQFLTDLGFKVNPDKTFLEGNFKESCGMDAYRGVDITPSYVLDLYDVARPSTLASVRECSNNLFLGGWWHTSRALELTVPLSIRENVPVVNASSGCPGWASFCGDDFSGLKTRWNTNLQRAEYRIMDVTTSIKRCSPGGNASLLQYFLESPEPGTMIKWNSGYDERPGLMVKSRWVVDSYSLE